MSKPKILIYSPVMEVIGGLETHVIQLSQRLAASGWVVTLLTTSNSCNPNAREELAAAGVEFREMQSPRLSTGKITRLAWLLEQVALLRFRTWDVIYTNAQGELARFVWLARSSATRIVHHHHTAGDEEEQRTTWSRGFERLLQNAPKLVACSRYTKAALGKRLKRNDIEVLPCVTEELKISQAEPATSSALLRFGFLGRLANSKGLDVILALSSASDLDSIEWHIHGVGPDYTAVDFSGIPTVRFHGRYAGAGELATALEKLDAVVLFSRHSEGLPLTLIEAMAAGLPWIATDRGGTAELSLAPENCRVISANASLAETKREVLDLAAAIRGGRTSRERQKAVYRAEFEPSVVFERWQTFLAT